MAARNTDVGRHFTSSPPAKSKMPPIGGPTGPKTNTTKPANSKMNQKQESGGGVFQPVQKPVAGINGKRVNFYGK